MVSGAFLQARRSRPREWSQELLAQCSSKELAALAQLLGIPTSGTKAKKIARLCDLGDLRETLSAFEDPDALVQRYKRKELHAMARRAKVYLGGSKRLLACSLLNWRNSCRQRGQSALKAAQQAAHNQPRELRLPFVFDRPCS